MSRAAANTLIINIFSALSLLFLRFYWHSNIIRPMEGNSNIQHFLLFVIFSLIAIAPYHLTSVGTLKVSRKVLFLTVFCLFVFFRFALQHPGNGVLTSYFIGSSGGILFFLLTGLIVGLNPLLSGNMIYKKYVSSTMTSSTLLAPGLVKVFIISIIIIISSVLSFQEFSFYSSSIRQDLFLVDTSIIGGDIGYQRIGDLLNMNLLLSIMAASVLMFMKFRTSLKGVISMLFCALSYVSVLASFGLTILNAMVVGSNKGAALSASFFLLFILLFCLMRKNLLVECVMNMLHKLDALVKFRIPTQRLGFLSWVTVAALSILFLFNLYTKSEFFLITRLSGFAENANILESRIVILVANFWTQFDVAPLWGHPYADGLTTGSGSFMHSLPLYILIHTGIVGLVLFLLFLRYLLSDKLKSMRFGIKYPHIFSADLAIDLIGFIAILLSLSLATIGTSLFWGFLWFCIGISIAHNLPGFEMKKL